MGTRLLIISVGLGVTAAAAIQKGAFFLPASLLLPGLLALLALYKPRLAREDVLVLAALGTLASWWLVDASLRGNVPFAVPFLGGTIGFGSAYVLGRGAEAEERVHIVHAVVAIGVLVAAGGLVGSVLHYSPLAIESVGLWRLSGTITYANAAGFLLAMMIPLVSCIETRPARLGDLACYLLVAALVATISRGAYLAFLAVSPLFVGSLVRRRLVPVILGLAAGSVAVATAGGEGIQPLLMAALAVGGVGTVLFAGVSRRGWFVAASASSAAVLVAVAMSQGKLARAVGVRLSGASLETRFAEWRAALEQFRSNPLMGAGPEQNLVLRTPEGLQIARFAHNEYLQVAASSGLVGLVLLLLVVGLTVLRLRSAENTRDAISRAAAASLAIFALAGVSDFSWHLPAITMTAGWMAGIAAGPQNLSAVSD